MELASQVLSFHAYSIVYPYAYVCTRVHTHTHTNTHSHVLKALHLDLLDIYHYSRHPGM